MPENAMIRGSTGQVIIPIAVLPKGVLWSWWVQDGGGAPLSVVSRRRSSELVEEMLCHALESAGVAVANVGTERETLLGFVNNGDNAPVKSAEALFRACKKRTNKENAAYMEFVLDLVRVLESSWVVLVEVPEAQVGQRMIIKYGYDLQALVSPLDVNEDNDSYWIPISDPGFSSSLHLEVRVPPELEIFEISLVHVNADQTRSRVIGNTTLPNSVAHMQNDLFIPRFCVAHLEFRVRPVEAGLRRFTDFVLVAVTLVVIFLACIRFGDSALFLHKNWRNHSTAAVILALPALLLSWIARTPEAAVVKRAFHRLRLINIWLAMGIFSMAAALSAMWQPWVWAVLWTVPIVCCTAALLLRYLEYVVRMPSEFMLLEGNPRDASV
ncbi:hypothetical protein OK351_12085 [Glutamicibacter sp. MNS18]|uniref:hypothetical protein n=1 Tax=Glutamicibacter sp. MNS18 TaxID=2989817 RepID=UPI0022367890|nr:hypothetical protein [Glutamicibacter sp. MNS18]MCW4466237.1 hypothetical protein [Glutamicibacter sp. MNS18]